MIDAYVPEGGSFRHVRPGADALPDDAVWIDLLDPSREEERAVESLCGIGVPTREEMREIEVSSRLYTLNGNDFMTVSVVHGLEGGKPAFAPVTFILTGERLVTLRYSEPKPFSIFSSKLCREPIEAALAGGLATRSKVEPPAIEQTSRKTRTPSSEMILIGLLETIVDRAADMLEAIAADLDQIGAATFSASDARKPAGTRDFKSLLKRLGAAENLTSKARESLATLERMMPFLQFVFDRRKSQKDLKAHIKSMARDIASLNDYLSFLSNKITFLLDTTVGMISIEQNGIIKIFSVAAVGFMPPTLIASIYGMNFRHMPELEWSFGYPFAIALMIVAAILPLAYFRYRNWL